MTIETNAVASSAANYDPASDLAEVRALTRQMRSAEKEIVGFGKKRRELLHRLRANGVPFRILAEQTGTSEHAIYKDLRWGKR